ncbi:hypothetical protein [Tautonia sociabilis]|uniref:Uncharacterized protein n=1 Tax=Tautonia sociabilis TaxID=2080755 RepID=A0A432MEE4_9BACT|nr:hypothetical protein [Tautonia sociabilis]RUL83774.1 hypothetical protein TsocGM_21550 [Tautonia sociabilis]
MALDRPRPRSRPRRGALTLALLLLPVSIAGLRADDGAGTPSKPRRPDLTDPVLCLSARGFRDFVPREVPELTRDEKLQIYYEPFNYTIIRVEEGKGDDARVSYRAHLTQDARLRKAGESRVLQEHREAIDYQPESEHPPVSTFMLYLAELKQFPPGDYEVDLVLRDELAEGRPETKRTVAFSVVRTPGGR